jgi:hypothetical protein
MGWACYAPAMVIGSNRKNYPYTSSLDKFILFRFPFHDLVLFPARDLDLSTHAWNKGRWMDGFALSRSKETVTTETITRPGLSSMLVILDVFSCPTYDRHVPRHEKFKCP